jgi:hypothetical protein
MSVTKFGWPLPKRQAHLQELSQNGAARLYDAPIDFMGQERVLPVWRISIDLPRYRLLNGRTSSLQQEWLAQNPGRPPDFFLRDPESDETQKVQHELLKQLIAEKGLLPFFNKIDNKQKDFIILDHLGFVVNGNRRLCAWRELLAKDSQKYGHFDHVNVLVLPKSDEEAIDRLEAQLQLEPDILAGYSWHACANMLLDRMRLHGLNEKSLATFYNRRESEIAEYIDMRNYAAEYLKARGKEGRWSELGDTEFAFRAMVKARKQIPSPGRKRLFEVGAFALLDDPQGGRLYEYIPELQKFHNEIREGLLQEFKIEQQQPLDDDPLGADPHEMASQLLAEIIDEPANRARTTEIIKDTIETQESLEREKDSASYVLKQLQKANAAVQSALAATHKPDTIRGGISETIESIETGLISLRQWLKGNGKSPN